MNNNKCRRLDVLGKSFDKQRRDKRRGVTWEDKKIFDNLEKMNFSSKISFVKVEKTAVSIDSDSVDIRYGNFKWKIPSFVSCENRKTAI